MKRARAGAKEHIHGLYEIQAPGRDVTNMPLPSAEREALKRQWREAVERHPLMPRAQELYERLLPRCEDDYDGIPTRVAG